MLQISRQFHPETHADVLSQGNSIMRKAFMEWGKKREEKTLSLLESDTSFKSRYDDLVIEEQKKLREVAKAISHAEKEPEREHQLIDTLLRAYEFRAFHDVLEHLEGSLKGSEQLAAMLEYLTDWKVVESRALLEIVSTRLDIVDRFHKLIVEGAPEKASRIGSENIHDLLARHPWLLNPRYQVVAEEKGIRSQLREMEHEADGESRERIDFLAHKEDKTLTIIEIKRPGLAVTLAEMQRLTGYLDQFRSAHEEVTGVFVASNFKPNQKTVDGFLGHFEIVSWAELFGDARKFLEHFRSILTSDVSDSTFDYRKRELKDGKKTLQDGAYIDKTKPRSDSGRLGVQDTDGKSNSDGKDSKSK